MPPVFGPRNSARQVVTLTVNGGSELSWRLSARRSSEDIASASTSGSALRLQNVRVVVEDGARLSVGIAAEESEGSSTKEEQDDRESRGSRPLTMLTLEGAAQQVRS